MTDSHHFLNCTLGKQLFFFPVSFSAYTTQTLQQGQQLVEVSWAEEKYTCKAASKQATNQPQGSSCSLPSFFSICWKWTKYPWGPSDSTLCLVCNWFAFVIASLHKIFTLVSYLIQSNCNSVQTYVYIYKTRKFRATYKVCTRAHARVRKGVSVLSTAWLLSNSILLRCIGIRSDEAMAQLNIDQCKIP